MRTESLGRVKRFNIVNEAVRHELAEDQDDLAAFAKRAKEPAISYEALLKKLKADGKI